MMIVVMKSDATVKQTSSVIKRVQELGFEPHLSKGEEKTIVGIVGNGKKVTLQMKGKKTSTIGWLQKMEK